MNSQFWTLLVSILVTVPALITAITAYIKSNTNKARLHTALASKDAEHANLQSQINLLQSQVKKMDGGPH